MYIAHGRVLVVCDMMETTTWRQRARGASTRVKMACWKKIEKLNSNRHLATASNHNLHLWQIINPPPLSNKISDYVFQVTTLSDLMFLRRYCGLTQC